MREGLESHLKQELVTLTIMARNILKGTIKMATKALTAPPPQQQ